MPTNAASRFSLPAGAPTSLIDAPRHPSGSLDPEFLDPIPQRAEGNTQLPGGLGLVVAGLFEGLDDRGALEFLDLVAEAVLAAGRDARPDRDLPRLGLAQLDVVSLDPAVLAQGDRPLQHVLKFADIAGERMREQHF